MNKELSAEDRDQVRQLVAEILKDEAHLHIGSKRYALAKKRLSQALAQGYDEAKYYADMAYIATELGAPLQSIAHRKKSLSCFKKKNDWLHVVHAHIFLTKNYADLKNKRQARYHAKRAYKLCVDHVVCSKALPLLGNIASALWHVGYKEQCIDVMAQVLDVKYGVAHEDREPLESNQFYYLCLENRFDEAIPILERMRDEERVESDFTIRNLCKKMNRDDLLSDHLKRRRLFYAQKTISAQMDYSHGKNVDPAVSVNGLTVDLKQTDDGSIGILELNFLPASGLNGYNAYHKTSLQDRVNKDYKVFSGQLNAQGFEGVDQYLRHHFTGMGSVETYENLVTMMCPGLPVSFNASLNALTAQHNKDDFVLNAQRLRLAEFIPYSVVASRYETQDAIMNRAGQIKTDHAILKTSNDARGDGVEIVSTNRLPNIVSDILNGGAWHGCQNPKSWEQDYHPNFVIQECVPSKPCRASDGEMYDATMRVALTHVFNHETGQGEIITHGMFWKLPKTPISSGTSRDKIVSLAKNDDIIKGRPHSARVAPTRQVQVQKQLQKFFDGFGAHMVESNAQVIERKLLTARLCRHSPQAMLATEQLTSHPYGNLIGMIDKDNRDGIKSVFDMAKSIKNPHADLIKRTWLNDKNGRSISLRDARLIHSRAFII